MAHHHFCRGALLAAADSLISSAAHFSLRTAQHNSIAWLLPPNPPSRAPGPLLQALLLRLRTLHTSPSPLGQHPPASSHNPSPPSSKSPATSPAACHSRHPVVPGTWFRVVTGSSRVAVEHVAGWSDVAELRGRPAGGSETVWRVTPETPPLQPDGGEGHSSLTAQPYKGNMPNVRQVYDVRPDVLTSAGDGVGDGAGDNGYPVVNHLDSEVTGAKDGLLHFTVPEKWISFDINTTGGPVSVSRVVEADLRVASGGAAVTLGSVRGLQVRIDTTAVASFGGGEWSPGSSHCCDGGAVKGGEVSGTVVTVQAAGPITLRRVVGGNVRLAMVATAVTSSTATAPTATVTSAVNPEDLSVAAASAVHLVQHQQSHKLPAMDLGAVYGGKLSIRTAGNAVRIGTLDCGSAGQQQSQHRMPSATAGAADTAAAVETSMSCIASSGNGDREGDGTAAVGTTPVSYDGAKIQTCGGAVCLDGVDGDAVVESGGGAIKVLAHARLRSLVLRSGGGPIDIALSHDSAPELLEVRNTVQLDIDADLGPHLKIYESSPQDSDLKPKYETAKEDTASSRVWRASVIPEPESGRSTGRGGSGQVNSGRGRIEVHADGGAVRLRRLSWMDALRLKVADRQGKKQ